MPSSSVWIGLVAVWLFVLVPMLVDKRPRIRQDELRGTRDQYFSAATATLSARAAAGHRSDPNWQPEP